MPNLAPAPFTASVSAADLAEENWQRNVAALSVTQSPVLQWLGPFNPHQNWVLARDGSLTAMEPTGRWWSDCSVPLLASRALLKTLTAGAAGSCLLSPPSAAMVIAARERIGIAAPLFVIQPDLDIARMILACNDFSDQIARNRLWFAMGSAWADQLQAVFKACPGLATPVQFIRTKLSPETLVGAIIADAQKVFSTVVAERAELIVQLQSRDAGVAAAGSQRILLIGPADFRLWDDDTYVLQEQLRGESNVHRFDTTEPLNSSPVALLQAAQDCGLIVTANLYRADCNHLLSTGIPWITWMTLPAAPSFQHAGPHDGLILADSSWKQFAVDAGWPAERIKIQGWPAAAIDPAVRPTDLAMIVNTHRVELPASVRQFSSHRLLWELIEEELAANPFAVDSVDAYLTNRSGQLNIAADALDRQTFIEQLIIPAFQQSLARLLIQADIPLAIWGSGWSDLDEFSSSTRGELTDRQAFLAAVASAKAIIRCWPRHTAHPVDSLGKMLLYPGNDASTFIRRARHACTGAVRASASTAIPAKVLAATIFELANPCWIK